MLVADQIAAVIVTLVMGDPGTHGVCVPGEAQGRQNLY